MALLRIAVAAVCDGEVDRAGRTLRAIQSRDSLGDINQSGAENRVLRPGSPRWTELTDPEGFGCALKQQVIPGGLGFDLE
jgi:hypothetical protein